MMLLIPLALMVLLVASAAGAGVLMRGSSSLAQKIGGVAGALAVLLLPLIADWQNFDGNCYAVDGAKSSCTLAEHLWDSFAKGLVPMIPPILIWLATYGFMLRRTPA